jgi:hypothetical protein
LDDFFVGRGLLSRHGALSLCFCCLSQNKHTHTFDKHTQGPGVLVRGLLPRLLYLAPLASLVLATYEATAAFLVNSRCEREKAAAAAGAATAAATIAASRKAAAAAEAEAAAEMLSTSTTAAAGKVAE